MAISEKTLQEAIRDKLLSLDRLEGRTVVINDWDALRAATRDDAPMAIIDNADEFESRQDSFTVTNNFVVKITLVVGYETDKVSHDEFRDLRQDVIDAFTDSERSAGGLSGVDLARIASGSPVDYIYDQYIREEDFNTVDPAYIFQTLLFYFEQF